MRFNKLINHILSENVEVTSKQIPALDGKREVYYIEIGTGSFISKLQRADSYMVKVWDWEKAVLPSYNEVIEAVTRIHEFQAEDIQLLHTLARDERFQIYHQLVKLKNIPGAWKILRNIYAHEDAFIVGAEIDPAFIRAREINKSLQDVDTTGFEDLL
jgi:hypothetical protein